MNIYGTYTITGKLSLIIFVLAIIGAITVIKKIINILFIRKPRNIKHKNWNDFDRIILHTKTRLQTPLSQYIPNQMYYDVFMKNPYNDINVKNMMIDILAHIKYDGPMPNIKYTLLGNEVSKHFTRGNELQSYIQITSEPKLPPIDLLALIIHECMYIYKSYHKIEYSTVFNQENVADTLAVYLGFYKNLSVAHKYYTSQEELDYIYTKIYC